MKLIRFAFKAPKGIVGGPTFLFAADLIFVLFAQIKDRTFGYALEKNYYYETRHLKFEILEGFAFFIGGICPEFEFWVVRRDCLTCGSQTDTCSSASEWIYCQVRLTMCLRDRQFNFMGNDLPCTWESALHQSNASKGLYWSPLGFILEPFL